MWNRKLGRKADHRKALLRNMATSLIENGQIYTLNFSRQSMAHETMTVYKKVLGTL